MFLLLKNFYLSQYFFKSLGIAKNEYFVWFRVGYFSVGNVENKYLIVNTLGFDKNNSHFQKTLFLRIFS